jgi:hypothetical protein
MSKAVAAFAKKNGFENASRAFIWLLNGQLNRYGYFEEDYTDKMVDKPTPESVLPPSLVRKGKVAIEKQPEYKKKRG